MRSIFFAWRSLPLGTLDFWSEQPSIRHDAMAKMARHDLPYRGPVEKVVKDRTGIDVQRWTIVAAVATGRCQNLHSIGESSLSHCLLQNRQQSATAALGAIRSETEMDSILATR